MIAIEFDGSKYYGPVIAFTPNDIIFKDQFVNVQIKSNDVWIFGYPPEWSEEKGDAYWDQLRGSYDWPAIYELYKKYEQAIKSRPERLNGKTPQGDAKV
jgi:hypothetical protein